MLVSLSIKNYALIQEANLSFKDGFTVITGETGAGKSILLGALGLITGKRADSSSVGDASKKCVIEGVFEIESYHLKTFFNTYDLDYEASTIIRRELMPSGKSRAFINDTPVTLQQLQVLGERLIDIHSQHKTLEVLDIAYQFDIIDTFSGTQDLLKTYTEQYNTWKRATNELEEIQEVNKKAQLEYDYQSFLFKELDEASLVEGEFETLEEQLNTLSHAEEIKEGLSEAQQRIGEEQLGVLDTLAGVRATLNKLVVYGSDYEQLSERVSSIFLELQDTYEELEQVLGKVQSDPKELERVNSRVQQLYSLMQKHQVQDVAGLITIRDELDTVLYEVQNVDGKIAALEKEIAFAKAESTKTALVLSKKRKAAIPSLVASLEKILVSLGMPNALLVCLLYTSPSPRDQRGSRMPSSA